eukprot:1180952-Prorocentrum_minimum.AAC.1
MRAYDHNYDIASKRCIATAGDFQVTVKGRGLGDLPALPETSRGAPLLGVKARIAVTNSEETFRGSTAYADLKLQLWPITKTRADALLRLRAVNAFSGPTSEGGNFSSSAEELDNTNNEEVNGRLLETWATFLKPMFILNWLLQLVRWVADGNSLTL